MRYRYLDDFRRGISVSAIFSYGIAVLGTPQCPPPFVKCVWTKHFKENVKCLYLLIQSFHFIVDNAFENPKFRKIGVL